MVLFLFFEITDHSQYIITNFTKKKNPKVKDEKS